MLLNHEFVPRPPNDTGEILQIINGAENITNFVLQHYLMTQATMDVCLDFVGPSVVATDMRIMKGAADMAKRGIRLRLITDITKQNINHRHLDGIKGNFGILDGREYNMHIIHQESQAPTQRRDNSIEGYGLASYSNTESTVWTYSSIFEKLWLQSEKYQLN